MTDVAKAPDVCPLCSAAIRVSLRDRNDNLALPVAVCTNAACETAIVLRDGSG